jgi:hypothetical protein
MAVAGNGDRIGGEIGDERGGEPKEGEPER